ncbi:lysoplasmalogenase family protein [Flavobacterium sp.]|uniref:lysoplasmalogenase family protein n=1 Tax=Flavobacterium sp. TaxID=239 RepID=UPI003D13BDDA
MDDLLSKEKEFEEKALLILYFGIGLIEVVAEYFEETSILYLLKPMLMPIMMFMYWRVSEVKSKLFLTALFFVFIANILFVSRSFNSAVIASLFFFVYRSIVIYIALKNDPVKKILPILLGSLPFLTAFSYLTFLTKDQLGKGMIVYLFQVFFLSFLGGLALSNYMMQETKKSFWLLINASFFAIIQFILVLKICYVSTPLFQPISMCLYLVAQFALYRYVLIQERKNKRLF